jgi:hypothetical protein
MRLRSSAPQEFAFERVDDQRVGRVGLGAGGADRVEGFEQPGQVFGWFHSAGADRGEQGSGFAGVDHAEIHRRGPLVRASNC